MTNILPRERGEEILAAHAAGMPVRQIARTYGHSPGTVRDYVRGRRAPGEPAPRTDDLAPFAGYCRQRLADDPHLRTPGLLAELSRTWAWTDPGQLSTADSNAAACAPTRVPTATSRGSADTPRCPQPGGRRRSRCPFPQHPWPARR